MAKSIRYVLLTLRDLVVSAGPFVLLAVALLGLAYWWLDPNPPKRVTLATGPPQSAYAEFGTRYQKALAANGVEVVLLPSEGSSANLELLLRGKADLGFVQGGSAGRAVDEDDRLLSLGIIIALLLPLSRIVPPLYEFRIRSRVFRWYAQLREIENRLAADPEAAPELIKELHRLEARVGKIVVPLSRADELYALRHHIELVRNTLLRT